MALFPGYKRLEVIPGRRSDRPTVRGTGITVDDILEDLAAGWSADKIAENYGISREAVLEAIRYALNVLRRVEVVAAEATG